MRQRGRGGGCVGIIPSVVKKKAVAKARLWPCTQMPSFLAVPSLRRQKASMTTTKYFPWRDRVGSHMKMGITFRYLVLQHMPTLTEYYYVCIFRAYFFLQNIWDNILSGNTGLSYILNIQTAGWFINGIWVFIVNGICFKRFVIFKDHPYITSAQPTQPTSA